MDNLKEKTAKGLFWGALNNGTIQMLNVLIGIMLGRKLSPEEWAPIGMIAIFSAIAGNLQSSGFSTAIINMKSPTSNDYNAVFWFNTLVSALVYLVLFACAPWIAWFFEQPCLTDLSRFIFLAFFISSFGISTNAYMMKNMMQREMTIVGITALIISGPFVLVVGRWYYVKWRPCFKVDFTPIRQTFRFSMNILITMIINTVNNHILTFVFGKLFTRTPQVVGNFFQAFKWDTMAYQTVGGTIEQVAQPVLVNLRDDEDESREVRVFRKMMRFTAFLAFPAMFGLSLVSEEFILATIGPKWIDCVPLLRVLCIGGAESDYQSGACRPEHVAQHLADRPAVYPHLRDLSTGHPHGGLCLLYPQRGVAFGLAVLCPQTDWSATGACAERHPTLCSDFWRSHVGFVCGHHADYQHLSALGAPHRAGSRTLRGRHEIAACENHG